MNLTKKGLMTFIISMAPSMKNSGKFLPIMMIGAAMTFMVASIGCGDTNIPANCFPSECGENLGNNGGDAGSGGGGGSDTGGSSGNGGSGGDAPCRTNPNFGKACPSGVGTYVCTPDGKTVVCPGTNPGDGNCATSPLNGQPCPGGKYGCNASGSALVCIQTPGGGTCASDPLNGQPCPGGKYGCNASGSALVCIQTPGGTTCSDPAVNGKPCTTIDGKPGKNGCSADGKTTICIPDPSTMLPCSDPAVNGKICVTTDGKEGKYACGPDGGTICVPTTPGTFYVCNTDPQFGKPCSQGVGICLNSGSKICNAAGTGLACSVSAKPSNPSGELCTNGMDDDCDGAIDESTCTSGSGGTGGSGGGTSCSTNPLNGQPCTGGTWGCNAAGTSLVCIPSGSGGSGGGGTGGSGSGGTGPYGGGESCQVASNGTWSFISPASLKSLLFGSSTLNTSNPLVQVMPANSLLGLTAVAGLSVNSTGSTTSGARLNLFEPKPVMSGSMLDEQATIAPFDIAVCRLMGITPPTPDNCNPTALGGRESTNYLGGLSATLACWRYGFCDSKLTGSVGKGYPATLFSFVKTVSTSSGYSGAWTGDTKWMVADSPPTCP